MKTVNSSSKERPLVSVITVVKNAQDFLEETVESVVCQTYPHVEYIVIDGASTDGTMGIIRKYEARISVLLSEPDNGVYDAMNKAVLVARGEWINFMNAGDSFADNNVIEKAVEVFDDNSDLVFGDAYIFDANMTQLVKADFSKNLFLETPFCHQSLFTRRDVLRECCFNTTYLVLADYDFILRCYFEGRAFQHINIPVAKYRLGGMSKKNILTMYVEGVKILLDAARVNKDIDYKKSPYYKDLERTMSSTGLVLKYRSQLSILKTMLSELSLQPFLKNPYRKRKLYKSLLGAYRNIQHLNVCDVLHVSTFENIGGAARAASRLNYALIQQGCRSEMLVLRKNSDSATVHELKVRRVEHRFKLWVNEFLLKKYGKKELEPHDPLSTNFMGHSIVDELVFKSATLVHLHWVSQAYIGIKQLEEMKNSTKPVVWTMHDMWPFTGGCHNPLDCRKYEKHCGECVLLGSQKIDDLSRDLLNRKKAIIDEMNVTVVAPSQWMRECALSSTIFRNKQVIVIPNAIDCEFFGRASVDEITGDFEFYRPEKRYVTFGAYSKARYKGLSYLVAALKRFSEHVAASAIELVVFGIYDAELLSSIEEDYTIHSVGVIADERKLRSLYSMTDVMVSPSLQESFGQVLTEAMACETACLGFNYSGTRDIIVHKDNGYLADYKSEESLAEGLEFCFASEERLDRMKARGREQAVRKYDYPVVAEAFIDLYSKITGT